MKFVSITDNTSLRKIRPIQGPEMFAHGPSMPIIPRGWRERLLGSPGRKCSRFRSRGSSQLSRPRRNKPTPESHGKFPRRFFRIQSPKFSEISRTRRQDHRDLFFAATLGLVQNLSRM